MFIDFYEVFSIGRLTPELSKLAYLDPGSGSYLLQLLLAGLLGAGFAVRMFWGRIKDFFKRGDSEDDPDGA